MPLSMFFFSISTVSSCCTQFITVIVFLRTFKELSKGTARWWPCCGPKCFFCCAETGKTGIFLMHTSLGPGAEMLMGLKWRKVDALLFLFIVLVILVARLLEMGFFNLWVRQVLDWSLFVLHFYWSVCTLAPKLIWPRRDWLCSLLLKFASFCCLQICVD